MSFFAGSPTDPFAFDHSVAQGLSTPAGRTAADPRPSAGTAVFIAAGQSSIANSENATHTIVNTGAVLNLSIYDGGVYLAQEPLLGAGVASSGGCWLVRLADKLITAGTYSRVILVPIAVGSTSVIDWAPGGGDNLKLVAAARRCAAQGYTPTAFLWAQGESDHALSQATYQAALSTVIATPAAVGFSVPWLVAQCTYTGGVTDSDLRAAQAAVVDNVSVFAGPDMDTLTGSYRYDNVHFNATGADAVADLWKTAIEAAL